MGESEIIQLLKDSGAIKFGDFTLASGKKSNYYIDVKLSATKPWVLRALCNEIKYEIMNIHMPDYIACVELGGVPIGTMVSDLTDIPLIIVRKAEKQHGTKGRLVGDYEPGKTAILVEDVTTTGGSSLSAVKALRDAGLVVDTVITVVDRQEGSEEALAAEGVKLIALTTAKEILAQGMNCQLSERCTSISPETKMRCELPVGHAKDHRNGSVGATSSQEARDTGKSIHEIHIGFVELLKARGEQIVQPGGKPMGTVYGYDKTIGLISAGSIYYKKEDGTYELLQDHLTGAYTGVKLENLGLCDAKCWYEAIDEMPKRKLSEGQII